MKLTSTSPVLHTTVTVWCQHLREFHEGSVMIRVKVGLDSYNRVPPRTSVKRGDLLGLSPYFDDQVVLSPIDGTIERIDFDPEERTALISIRCGGVTGSSPVARRNEG
jgi:hypothetical protein